METDSVDHPQAKQDLLVLADVLGINVRAGLTFGDAAAFKYDSEGNLVGATGSLLAVLAWYFKNFPKEAGDWLKKEKSYYSKYAEQLGQSENSANKNAVASDTENSAAQQIHPHDMVSLATASNTGSYAGLKSHSVSESGASSKRPRTQETQVSTTYNESLLNIEVTAESNIDDGMVTIGFSSFFGKMSCWNFDGRDYNCWLGLRAVDIELIMKSGGRLESARAHNGPEDIMGLTFTHGHMKMSPDNKNISHLWYIEGIPNGRFNLPYTRLCTATHDSSEMELLISAQPNELRTKLIDEDLISPNDKIREIKMSIIEYLLDDSNKKLASSEGRFSAPLSITKIKTNP